MPAAIPFAAALAAEYVAVEVGFVVAGTLAASAVGAIAGFAVSALLSETPSSQQDQGFAPQVRDTLVTIRQPITDWQYIFGRAKVKGAITFIHENTENKVLHIVITLAAHVCQEIEEIYFDDEVIVFEEDGIAVGGRYDRSGSYVHVYKSLGDEAGQPFPLLVTESEGEWVDTSCQKGWTKLWVRLAPGPAGGDMFPTGVPNITALIKGMKVYDPRTDTTVWSDNPSLCQNFIICDEPAGFEADYATEVDEEQLIAAANIDDEEVLLKPDTIDFTVDDVANNTIMLGEDATRGLTLGMGVRVSSDGVLPAGLSAATTYYVAKVAGRSKLATSLANARAGTVINITDAGTGTHTLTYYSEPRYTLNGTVIVNDTPGAILGKMLTANDGKMRYIGGKFRLHPAAYVTPLLPFDEDDLRGVPHISPRLASPDTCNGVKGLYIAEDNEWQATDFPPVMREITAPNITAGAECTILELGTTNFMAIGAASNAVGVTFVATGPGVGTGVIDQYLGEDQGDRSWLELTLPYTKSASTAQRIARIELERRRQQTTMNWPGKFNCYRVQPGSTCMISFAMVGYSGKIFEVDESTLIFESDGTLGSDHVLRETAPAVYDWNITNEKTVDLAPDTNLPSAFNANPPGTPSVTESLYETTGSAGVKVRATVTWAVSTSSFIRYYLLEYRVHGTTDWIMLPRVPTNSTIIDDVDPVKYDFRVRCENEAGVRSEYSATTVKEFIGLTADPADVVNFAVRNISGKANCTMAKTTDLDVKIGGHLLIRHSPLMTGATWNDCVPVAPDGYPGDTVDVDVPLMQGTYAAKWQDSTGHTSVNAVFFVVTEALLSGFTTLATVTESPTFPGFKTNTEVVSSALQLTGGTDVSPTGNYNFYASIDLGSLKTVRLFPSITSASFDAEDLWDSDDDVDSAEDVDAGGDIDDVVCALEVRVSEIDPNGSPGTWGPWHTLPGQADYTGWGFEFRLTFSSGSATHNRAVTALSVVAKQPT